MGIRSTENIFDKLPVINVYRAFLCSESSYMFSYRFY